MENNDKKILELSNNFNVKATQLYNAWIDPEVLKKWWHPSDLTLEQVVNDVKPEGDILYTFKNKEGKEVRVSGKYEEVEENRRLVYSWNWEVPEGSEDDGNFKLSIDFNDMGNGATLKVKQEEFSKDEVVSIHREAWQKAFKDLQQFLEKPNNGEGVNNNETHSAPGAPGVNNDQEKTGYNEISDQEKVGGYS